MGNKTTVLEIIALLKGLRDRHESGSVYVTSDLARSAAILIREGQIIDMRAGPFKGLRAVERIKDCKAFTYRIDPLSITTANIDHEESDAIFAALDKVLAELQASLPAEVQPVVVAEERLPEPEVVEERIVVSDEALLAAVSESLMSFMGPASRFICEDIAKPLLPLDSEQKLQQLITLLAAEIDDSSDAIKFSQLAQGATDSFFR